MRGSSPKAGSRSRWARPATSPEATTRAGAPSTCSCRRSSSCMMLSFLAHADHADVDVEEYTSAIEGTIRRRADDNRYAFTAIQVRPRIVVGRGQLETARGFLAKAERDCFISASTTAKIDVEWELAEPASTAAVERRRERRPRVHQREPGVLQPARRRPPGAARDRAGVPHGEPAAADAGLVRDPARRLPELALPLALVRRRVPLRRRASTRSDPGTRRRPAQALPRAAAPARVAHRDGRRDAARRDAARHVHRPVPVRLRLPRGRRAARPRPAAPAGVRVLRRGQPPASSPDCSSARWCCSGSCCCVTRSASRATSASACARGSRSCGSRGATSCRSRRPRRSAGCAASARCSTCCARSASMPTSATRCWCSSSARPRRSCR